MASHAPCLLTCPAVIRGLCWYLALYYQAATPPLQKENTTKQESCMQLHRLTPCCQQPEPGSGWRPLPTTWAVCLWAWPCCRCLELTLGDAKFWSYDVSGGLTQACLMLSGARGDGCVSSYHYWTGRSCLSSPGHSNTQIPPNPQELKWKTLWKLERNQNHSFLRRCLPLL